MSDTHAFAYDDSADLGQPLSESENRITWAIYGILLAALTFGYWNMFEYTASFWGKALYSHGYIIPLIAGYLLWTRSGASMKENEGLYFSIAMIVLAIWPVKAIVAGETLPGWIMAGSIGAACAIFLHFLSRVPLRAVGTGERWIGFAILVASLCLRIPASTFDMNPVDRLTYIGAVIGITQMIGGWSMLKWAGPPMVFLVFMFPLPSVLENSVLYWLQRLAAISSTWTLQLLGIPALREGSKLTIDGLNLDVADACSGLRMSTIFGAMSVALAMLINRPWWDRLAILVFAIPVALFTNVIRITVTALIYMAFPDSEAAHKYVHDWAGLAMMPVAMGILWLELELLRKITVPIDTEEEYAAFGTPA